MRSKNALLSVSYFPYVNNYHINTGNNSDERASPTVDYDVPVVPPRAESAKLGLNGRSPDSLNKVLAGENIQDLSIGILRMAFDCFCYYWYQKKYTIGCFC
jgi:hypothetical protein